MPFNVNPRFKPAPPLNNASVSVGKVNVLVHGSYVPASPPGVKLDKPSIVHVKSAVFNVITASKTYNPSYAGLAVNHDTPLSHHVVGKYHSFSDNFSSSISFEGISPLDELV